MGLKVRRGGLAAFITGCCVLGIVITVSQLNENKPLNGYVDGRQNTIVTTAAPATKPPRDPDMQLYTDNTVGLSLQVPLKWNRVIKGGEVTFIESDTAAYVRVSVGAYPKGLAGITETDVRADVEDAGGGFVSFTREGNSGYTAMYQMYGDGVLYDYIEINRYDLNYAARVTICIPDDAYKSLQKQISAVCSSVYWEPHDPIPEDFLLVYNEFGDFEFAVPSQWQRGIYQGEYVARDPVTGAEMHVSVALSDRTYENVNQAVYAEYLAEGKEGFAMRQFSANTNLIYSVSSYMINGFLAYRVDYLVATGVYEYGISFLCPVDCYTDTAGLFETAFTLFRTF